MNTDDRLFQQFLANHTPLVIASIEEMKIEQITMLITSVPVSQAIIILTEMAPFLSGKVVEKLTEDMALKLLRCVEVETCESILRVTQKQKREELLKALPKVLSSFLKRTLRYPKNHVGAHLEPFVLTLTNRITVAQALSIIKNSKATVKPQIYLLNGNKQLIGFIELSDLVKTKKSADIDSIRKVTNKAVFADMNAQDLVQQWDHSFNDLPVIKVDKTFLGSVSRATLNQFDIRGSKLDSSAVKAGNALGDLYMIGLTSLLGNSGDTSLKQ